MQIRDLTFPAKISSEITVIKQTRNLTIPSKISYELPVTMQTRGSAIQAKLKTLLMSILPSLIDNNMHHFRSLSIQKNCGVQCTNNDNIMYHTSRISRLLTDRYNIARMSSLCRVQVAIILHMASYCSMNIHDPPIHQFDSLDLFSWSGGCLEGPPLVAGPSAECVRDALTVGRCDD